MPDSIVLICLPRAKQIRNKFIMCHTIDCIFEHIFKICVGEFVD